MIEAIFWDNDGVLVDTEALFFEANRKFLEEHGVPLDHDTFAEWSLRRGVSVFEMLENKTDAERLALRDERNRRYVSTLRKGVDVFEGVEACLAELHGQLPMAVVTSAYPDSTACWITAVSRPPSVTISTPFALSTGRPFVEVPMTHGTLTCFLILSCFDHQNARRGAPPDRMVDAATDGGGDGLLTVAVTLGDGSDAPQPRTL